MGVALYIDMTFEQRVSLTSGLLLRGRSRGSIPRHFPGMLLKTLFSGFDTCGLSQLQS